MNDAPANVRESMERRKVALGDILREWMIEKDVGCRELAARMGGNVRRQYIQSVLKGQIEPTAEMLQRIVDALDAA